MSPRGFGQTFFLHISCGATVKDREQGHRDVSFSLVKLGSFRPFTFNDLYSSLLSYFVVSYIGRNCSVLFL